MKKSRKDIFLMAIKQFLEKLVEHVPTLKKIGLDPEKLIPTNVVQAQQEDEFDDEPTRTEIVNDSDSTDPAIVVSDLADEQSDDEDDEDEEEDDEDEDDEDDEDEEEKPKKKLKPIHIIIIVGVLVLLMFDDDQSAPESVQEKAVDKPQEKSETRLKPKKPQGADEKEEMADPQQDFKQDQDDRSEEQTPLAVQPEEAQKPLMDAADEPGDLEQQGLSFEEDKASTDVADPIESLEDEPRAIEPEQPVAQPTTVEMEDVSFDDLDLSDLDSEVSEDPLKQEDEPALDKGDIQDSEGDEDWGSAAGFKQVDKQQKRDDTDLADKMLEKLEKEVAEDRQEKTKQDEQKAVYYVKPPSYEKVGRGLVYSCTGQHWACVDGFSYGACERNYRWHEHEKTKVECYPDSVYLNHEDCAMAQTIKINSAASTDFCH